MIKLPREAEPYFPYSSVRPHQDDFISTIYNAVDNRRSVLSEGSNGLGKTISSLSACLPIAIKKNLKILYVARTHRQHDRVVGHNLVVVAAIRAEFQSASDAPRDPIGRPVGGEVNQRGLVTLAGGVGD